MKTTAKVVLDSTNPDGDRVTTIEATYPRNIHSEYLTHRKFSRNAASSRAIPAEKQIETVRNEPFVPSMWQVEAGGMQGVDGLPDELAGYAEALWQSAAEGACAAAESIRNVGTHYCDTVGLPEDHPWRQIRIHKTMPNRIIEPWAYITVIMTGDDWSGFFQQRCHPDAEIHMREMAEAIRAAMAVSKPQKLGWGEWHLPYVTGYDEDEIRSQYYQEPVVALCEISTARCARVSYMNHDGTRDLAKDRQLFQRLKEGSGFGHRSPAEQVVCAARDGQSGNLSGKWTQFRKVVWGPNG